MHLTRCAVRDPNPRIERRQSTGAGELPLTRGERIVLGIGLYTACALIALVEWPSARHHGAKTL
jgi:hypothetical protein